LTSAGTGYAAEWIVATSATVTLCASLGTLLRPGEKARSLEEAILAIDGELVAFDNGLGGYEELSRAEGLKELIARVENLKRQLFDRDREAEKTSADANAEAPPMNASVPASTSGTGPNL
jgi:hypothetical protein